VLPNRLRAGLLVTTILMLGQSHWALAQDTGDVAAGRALAKTWCDNCHVVDPAQQTGTSTGAPTFSAIAAMRSTTPLGLHVFLQTPHDRMPDLHLSRAEIDDVVAYILSLKQ
jgi:mono/diheme cytochrome c family protein